MKFPKITKNDIIGVSLLVIFIIIMAIPVYKDKEGCEVAQAGYKCSSAKDVMIDNCKYWAKWNCNSTKDISLPQIEWYIRNLCDIYKRNHEPDFNCDNLKEACNDIVGEKICK